MGTEARSRRERHRVGNGRRARRVIGRRRRLFVTATHFHPAARLQAADTATILYKSGPEMSSREAAWPVALQIFRPRSPCLKASVRSGRRSSAGRATSDRGSSSSATRSGAHPRRPGDLPTAEASFTGCRSRALLPDHAGRDTGRTSGGPSRAMNGSSSVVLATGRGTRNS
jgi:hypothetical protein